MTFSEERQDFAARYYIDGFRSLVGFDIFLNPGLNVLVGPNGSGKTNFIDFLDFLDRAMRLGASNAVSYTGGVSRVFSIENSKKSSPTLRAIIRSVAELYGPDSGGTAHNLFNFEYEIEVKFSRANSAIYISKERLKLFKLRSHDEECLSRSVVGTILLTRNSPLSEDTLKTNVGTRLLTNNARNPLQAQSSYGPKRTPSENLSRVAPFNVDESIFASRLSFPAIDAVRLALTRGRSFNIIPACARTPDDLIRPPGIASDGSGLSSTLHFLQVVKKQSQALRRYNTPRMRRVGSESLDMVIEWTRLVFPQLSGIGVAQDPHTGKYLGNLLVGEEPLRIPLKSVSDGTLKWLALVCLILSGEGSYSLEEPENFLHPKMQQFLIALIRERLSEDSRTAYFILSTHSETIINQCTAEELILFEFSHFTSCHRVADPTTIQDQVNKTGFGLGYYYAHNVVS